MKIGIYGAGNRCTQISRNLPFIAVDGGIEALEELGIQPRLIVGDFDSSDASKIDRSIEYLRLPSHKDYTDTEIAVMEAIKRGFDDIEIYGVTGGRLDHFFAVCRLLVKYQNIKITIYDDCNKIYLLSPGTHLIDKNNYTYLSFFAIHACHLTLKDVAYPLDHYLLTYENGLCVSNEILNNQATVICDDYLFCLQTNNA